MSETELRGLDDVVKALRALPASIAGRNGGPLRRALYRAARPMRDNAEARAPRRTGNLAANVYIYRDRNPRASTGAAERYIIGVRTKRAAQSRSRLNRALGRAVKGGGGFGRLRGDAFYWHFVEFGTAKMEKRPFLRPAFESHKTIAVRIFERELSKGVVSAWREAFR